MAASSRQNRFLSNFTMPNEGEKPAQTPERPSQTLETPAQSLEKPPQARNPGFPNGTAWGQSGIWGAYAPPQREAVGSNVPPVDNAPPNGSASSARQAPLEAGSWRPSGPWVNTEPTRNTDGTIGDPYFSTSTSQPQMQSATGPVGRSSTTNPNFTLDPSTGSFKYDPFPNFRHESENGDPFGSTKFEAGSATRRFGTDKRGSQDTSHPNNITPSTHMTWDQHRWATAQAQSHSLPHVEPPVPVIPANPSPFQGHSHSTTHGKPPVIPPNHPSRQAHPNSTPHGKPPLISPDDPNFKGPFDGNRPSREEIMRQLVEGPRCAAHRYTGIARDYEEAYPPVFDSRHTPVAGDPSLIPNIDRGSQQLSQQTQGAVPLQQHQQQQQQAAHQHQVQQQQPSYYPSFHTPNYQPTIPPHLYNQFATNTNLRHPLAIRPGYLPTNTFFAQDGLPLGPNKDAVNPAKDIRSPLLEAFKSGHKTKHYELKDIYMHIVEFSGDQSGSRFIQHKLETANSDEKEQVFKEIKPNALPLMKDVYGNYVVQKLFEHGSQVQKKILAGIMEGNVADLAIQMYGCRVVQKALEHALVEQQQVLVNELKNEVLRTATNQHGNHVIQKIIQVVPRQHIGFIMDCFRGRVNELSTHIYGCRVIQRVLERGTEADKAMVMEEIYTSAQPLMMDQYGNYVIQHVIEHGKPDDRSKMTGLVMSHLVALSKHKFASNIVEKCIKFGTTKDHQRIREELTTAGDDGTSPLPLLMQDQYGNYVIQKLFNQLEAQGRASFVEEIKPELDSMKKIGTAGKQIVALDRLISTAAAPQPESDGTPASTPPGSTPPGSTPSASPTPQADIGSPTPTPNLTMEPNSPSSSPPSTNASAVGEAVNESYKPKAAPRDGIAACPGVRINEE